MADVLVTIGDHEMDVVAGVPQLIVGLTYFGSDVLNGLNQDNQNIRVPVPQGTTAAQVATNLRTQVVAIAANVPNSTNGIGVTVPASAILVPSFTRI